MNKDRTKKRLSGLRPNVVEEVKDLFDRRCFHQWQCLQQRSGERLIWPSGQFVADRGHAVKELMTIVTKLRMISSTDLIGANRHGNRTTHNRYPASAIWVQQWSVCLGGDSRTTEKDQRCVNLTRRRQELKNRDSMDERHGRAILQERRVNSLSSY